MIPYEMVLGMTTAVVGVPIGFNIEYWFKTMMTPEEYPYWKSTFEDGLYLNGLADVVQSDKTPSEILITGEPNLAFKSWHTLNLLVYGWSV